MRCMGTPEHEVERAELILIRARITQAFWADIRKGAIDAGMHNVDFVADLLQRGMEARKSETATA